VCDVLKTMEKEEEKRVEIYPDEPPGAQTQAAAGAIIVGECREA
jgi:hypothetical protein